MRRTTSWPPRYPRASAVPLRPPTSMPSSQRSGEGKPDAREGRGCTKLRGKPGPLTGGINDLEGGRKMKVLQVVSKPGTKAKLKALLKATERTLRGPHTTFQRVREG